MHRRWIVRVALAVATLCTLAVACGGGGKSSPKAYGGNVLLQQHALPTGGSATVYLSGTFYSAYTPGTGRDPFSNIIPPGQCVQTVVVDTGAVSTLLNAGPSFAAQAGGSTIVAVYDTASGFAAYTSTASLPVAAPVPADWDLVFSGSTELPATTLSGAVRLPGVVQITSPAIVPTGGFFETTFSGGTVAMTWTPLGADYLDLTFFSGNRFVECVAADQGSFTVPSYMVPAIPTNGSLAVGAFQWRDVGLHGRTVTAIGETYIETGYTIQP
ncbi:MAG TPA: hypothetical protein VMV18_07745 [bacterium]|nr:hypothetical protein [bacterium]